MDVLFQPVEAVDAWLTSLIEGAPLLVALAIAFVLGLRHASDPDHLVAVSSLVAADGGDVRAATRLGAWWGVGHAATLLAVGLPLIALKEQLPPGSSAGRRPASASSSSRWPPACSSSGCAATTAPARTGTASTTIATCATAAATPTTTATSARRGRRSGSGCCTASPARAPSWCC